MPSDLEYLADSPKRCGAGVVIVVLRCPEHARAEGESGQRRKREKKAQHHEQPLATTVYAQNTVSPLRCWTADGMLRVYMTDSATPMAGRRKLQRVYHYTCISSCIP